MGHGGLLRESVHLRSPEKGFWECLGDLPPDMPRRPETWVSLCNIKRGQYMRMCVQYYP